MTRTVLVGACLATFIAAAGYAGAQHLFWSRQLSTDERFYKALRVKILKILRSLARADQFDGEP